MRLLTGTAAGRVVAVLIRHAQTAPGLAAARAATTARRALAVLALRRAQGRRAALARSGPPKSQSTSSGAPATTASLVPNLPWTSPFARAVVP